MNNEFDLTTLMNNAPVIEITISETKIRLRIFFSVNCCEIMFKCYEQESDYRTSFAKAVFHMFTHMKTDNEIALTEADFINISDENLRFILDSILAQDSNIKSKYEKEQSEDVYERFYKANEIILKHTAEDISQSLEKVLKTVESLNKSLLTSLRSAIANISMPHDSLSGLISPIANIPAYNFSKFHSALTNIPSMSHLETPFPIQKMPQINFSEFQSALTDIPHIRFPELTAVLSNIPQPVFDIQAIVSPLHSLVESIRYINDNLAQTLQTPLLKMTEATQSLICSTDFSMLVYRKKWSKQRETLLKYRWFYSDELPDDLVYDIHERQEELSVDDVDKIIVDYFRQNKCETLKSMVKKWKSLPCFCCRTRIFHEALVNHSRKYFNASVTLLTLHTEGVITDFVRMNLENPRFKVGNAIKDIKKELIENEDASIYEYEVFSDVIERIEDTFNENFNHADPDATSNESRHKIAHGHAYETENEVDSLKRFLYLNEIYHLFVFLTNPE
jgi:hypothetical protein